MEKVRSMPIIRLPLAAMLLFTIWASALGAKESVTSDDSAQRQRAFRHSLQIAKNGHPYYGLDWRDLKLLGTDEAMVKQLKEELSRSGRSEAGIREQILWVDAAAGHPEGILALYDANVVQRPEDKSLPNAACWARADRVLDLQNALAVCDAAIAADRQGYTLVFRGKVELQLGRNAEALKDFNDAIGDRKFLNHPSFAQAVFGRGVARLRLGDPKGSEDLRAATTANSRVADTFEDTGISR